MDAKLISSEGFIPRQRQLRNKVGVFLFVSVAMILLQGILKNTDINALSTKVTPPTAILPCGPVDGIWLGEGLAAFLGVPYAEPPLGAKRFMPPLPASCWSGRLNASSHGPECIQSNGKGHEDCLTLDVFTPMLPQSQESGKAPLLPVVVWIHGGSLIGGSKTSYGPLQALVKRSVKDEKPFVLLAMNYRLNALGWMSLPELASGDYRGVSGNYGLLDQILALQWAQSNIQRFGGNPEHVTLFGQSSGGTSIFLLLASPAARGLFHSCLSLSGSPNISMDRSAKEKQDRMLWLPQTPCANHTSSTLASCLRSADPLKLVSALPEPYLAWGWDLDFPVADRGSLGWAGLAYVDGFTVARPVLEALSDGHAGNVSVLIQSLQCEDGNNPRKVMNGSAQDGRRYLERRLSKFGAGVSEVASFYEALAMDLGPADVQGAYTVTAFAADACATCGSVSLARAAAKGGARGAYVGTVVAGASRKPPLGSGLPYHNFDFTIVLAWAVNENIGTEYREDLANAALAQQLWNHWLSFFVFDRPGPSWPDLRAGNGSYMHALLGFPEHCRTRAVDDWKLQPCSLLEERLGIGEPYWWIN